MLIKKANEKYSQSKTAEQSLLRSIEIISD